MDLLPDPCKDRALADLKLPTQKPLRSELFWEGDKPNWKLIKEHLLREGKILKQDILRIITLSINIITAANFQFNLPINNYFYFTVEDPLVIVGDIHGQFYDLVNIIELGGSFDQKKYLFLGDFVDRGQFAVEVLILLLCIKINYPDSVFFLRGNHECRQMTSFFNFKQECKYKFDQEVYDMMMDLFDLIPLSCIINGKFLAVHGGLSPSLQSINEIKEIDRFKEPPKAGVLCDLLWSDPIDNENGLLDRGSEYIANEVRGCSYFYGNLAVRNFLEKNDLITIIRAHEAQLDGYKMHRWQGQGDYPMNNTLKIQQFTHASHPYLLPQFMDIFTWSIPFVLEKVSEMFYIILKQSEGYDDSQDQQYEQNLSKKYDNLKQKFIRQTSDQSSNPKIQRDEHKKLSMDKKRADILRKKIQFISKMAKFQKTLRQENEAILRIKEKSVDNKIPMGVLQTGKNGIQTVLQQFLSAKNADIINEKRPSLDLSPDNKQYKQITQQNKEEIQQQNVYLEKVLQKRSNIEESKVSQNDNANSDINNAYANNQNKLNNDYKTNLYVERQNKRESTLNQKSLGYNSTQQNEKPKQISNSSTMIHYEKTDSNTKQTESRQQKK